MLQSPPRPDAVGHVAKEDAQHVADLVNEADPDAKAIIIWAAARPVILHTKVIGGASSSPLMNDVRLKTQPRRFGFLYENVVMRPAMANEVSKALDAQPVLGCASDFGWVNRPRLWWTSIDWKRHPNDPLDDKRSKQGKWQRLRLEIERKAASSFSLDGLNEEEHWTASWTMTDPDYHAWTSTRTTTPSSPTLEARPRTHQAGRPSRDFPVGGDEV